MKFDIKYPNAEYMEEVELCVVRGDKLYPCWNCKELTNFYEINFGAFLCSDECLDIKYNEYLSATEELQDSSALKVGEEIRLNH